MDRVKMHKEEGNHEHSRSNDGHASRRKDNDYSANSKDQDHKADVSKSAIHVCGDWSEHISSSGKRYYYNCKTEVSQWEKPEGWINNKSDNSRYRKRDRPHDSQKSSSQRYDSKYRHSDNKDRMIRAKTSSSSGYQPSQHWSDRNSSEKHDKPRPKDNRKLDYASSKSPPFKNRTVDNQPRRDNNASGRHYSRPCDSDNKNIGDSSSNCIRRPVHHDRPGYYTSDQHSDHLVSGGPSNDHSNSSSVRSRNQSRDTRQPEDMDISPEHPRRPNAMDIRSRNQSTSRESRQPEDMDISPENTRRPSVSDNQKLTEQALVTLQKLQEAISSTLKRDQKRDHPAPQTTVNQSPRCSTDITSPAPVISVSQSPHIPESFTGPSDIKNCGGDSPRSEQSDHSSLAQSQGSSQEEDVAPNSLAAAAGIKPYSVQLTPSLTNYYKSDMTLHLSGWPTQHIEQQANQLSQEGTEVGNLHCAQVSADLKTARSLVRVAEIQATLHEQRVLLIKQEIKDLENLRTPSAYLSNEDA